MAVARTTWRRTEHLEVERLSSQKLDALGKRVWDQEQIHLHLHGNTTLGGGWRSDGCSVQI